MASLYRECLNKILSLSALVAAMLPSKSTWQQKLLSLDTMNTTFSYSWVSFSYNKGTHLWISAVASDMYEDMLYFTDIKELN